MIGFMQCIVLGEVADDPVPVSGEKVSGIIIPVSVKSPSPAGEFDVRIRVWVDRGKSMEVARSFRKGDVAVVVGWPRVYGWEDQRGPHHQLQISAFKLVRVPKSGSGDAVIKTI
jgi:hypothetical protein